jgi:acyl-CoA thioesterase I
MMPKLSSARSYLLTLLILPILALGCFSAAAQPVAATGKQGEQISQSQEKTILFIGDSLTAGYGVTKEEAFPALVGEMLKTKGHNVKIINGGISGSVSAEADRRLKWYLKSKPAILFLALGANDGFKGTPPAVIKRNLARAIDLAQENNIQVVLAGVKIFTNFGQEYTRDFEKLYLDLAKEKRVQFMPFILEGVALKKELNLADGKHPNPEGHKVLAENVVKELEKLL